VLASGRYDETTESSRRLLAHELAHVLQQRSGQSAHALQRQLYPPILPPIVIAPPTEIEVSAVDAREEPDTPWYVPSRYTGPIASLLRGDVVMTDIPTMVAHVLTFVGGRKMSRLNIMDHGNSNGVEIGDDWLATPQDVSKVAATLGRLRPKFSSGGFVHMQNCEAGQNRSLICALAAAFGVPVYAGTGLHNPIYGINFGDYVRCDPNGKFNPDAGRPSTPAQPSQRRPLGPDPGTPTA
jgi:Domain of unknown function (DUF4157)